MASARRCWSHPAVYQVPDGLSPRVAVLAELMTCAASLDKLKEFSSYAIEGFTSGDTVVVIGSGPLGLLHVAKADLMGAGQIIATDLSAHRLEWAMRCGADEVLDVSATTAQERLEIGLTNHPSTGYGPALRLLERYADRYPFEEMTTHEFGLADADLALRTSMDPTSMKVAIDPSR